MSEPLTDDRGVVQETEDHLRMLVDYHNDVRAVMVDPRAVLALFAERDAALRQVEEAWAETNRHVDLLRQTLERALAAERQVEELTAVLAAYRNAVILSREYDEDDDEPMEAWRAAYLAHIAYDPTLDTPSPTDPKEEGS